MSNENGAIPTLPDAPDDLLDALIAPLEQRLEQIDAHKRALREALDATSSEEAQLRRVLRAAFPDKYANTASRPKDKRAVKSISDEILDKIKDFCITYVKANGPDATIIQPVIRREFGINSGTSSSAFWLLREQGFLRLSGQKGNLKFYRLTQEVEEENGITELAA